MSQSKLVLPALCAALLGCSEPEPGPATHVPLPTSARELIHATLGDHRFVEPWLSVTGTYEPCLDTGGATTSADSGCVLPRPSEASLAEAGKLLRQVERRGQDQEVVQHTKALLEIVERYPLASSRPELLDAPITRLRQLVLDRPRDLRYQQDLAAALLIQSVGRVEAELPALSQALTSYELAPSSPANAFNWALALRRIPIRDFEADLALDQEEPTVATPWLREAQATMAAPPTADWSAPEACRRSLGQVFSKAMTLRSEEIFGDGSDSAVPVEVQFVPYLARDEGASLAEGDLLRELETALASCREEPGVSLLVQSLDRRLGEPVEALLALEALGEAVEALARPNSSDPTSGLQAARRRLAEVDHPMLPWVDYYLAKSAFNTYDYPVAEALLNRLQTRPEMDSLPHLRARVHLMRASAAHIQGEMETAAASFDHAVEDFQAVGDLPLAAYSASSSASASAALGDGLGAWQTLREAFQILPALPEANLRPVLVYSLASEILFDLDEPALALFFQTRATHLSGRTQEVLLKASMHARSAWLLHRCKKPQRAQRDMEVARKYLAETPESPDREAITADLALIEGELLSEQHPEAAQEALQEAYDLSERTRFELRLPRVHLARARISASQGRPSSANSSILAMLDELELQRALIENPRQRASFLDLHRQAYDLAVSSTEESRGAASALELSEASRARGLLEVLQPRLRRAPPNAWTRSLAQASRAPRPQGRKTLGEGVTALVFHQLEDRLLAWFVTDSPTAEGQLALRRFVEVPLSRTRLETMVAKIEASLPRSIPLTAFDAAVGDLSRALEPILVEVHGDQDLILVPDGFLHRVPFAALKSPDTGMRLAEVTSVLFAPSLALAHHPASPLSAGRVPGPVVSVGASRPAQSTLPPLRLARQEARRIADLYNGTALLGDAADPATVLEHLAQASIGHFAVHATPASRLSQQSRLHLGSPDPLESYQIVGSDLSRLKLVFLSACEGAAGPLRPSEGTASLVRDFHAAGASSVVATGWRIEDEKALDFALAFHRRLRAGRPPAEALRDAQLEFLAAADPERRDPRSWAAFQLFAARPSTVEESRSQT